MTETASFSTVKQNLIEAEMQTLNLSVKENQKLHIYAILTIKRFRYLPCSLSREICNDDKAESNHLYKYLY